MTQAPWGWWARRPTTAPRPRAGPGDRGSATAELAACLPGLVLLLFAALTSVVAVRTQLECVDAAREAARAAARGEDAYLAGLRVAPAGARLELTGDAQTVRAVVTAPVHPLGERLPGLAVSATAVAAIEPGVAGMTGLDRVGGS